MASLIILGIIGPWQIILVVLLVLILFGGKKIPELMRGIGQGMNEFKKATGDKDAEKGERKKEDDIRD